MATPAPIDGEVHHCLCCGKEVVQPGGRKEKKFCSDKCRNKWWNSNLLIRSIVKLNITLSVLTAKSHSVHMGISTGNIARMSAIFSTDLEVCSNGRDKCKK